MRDLLTSCLIPVMRLVECHSSLLFLRYALEHLRTPRPGLFSLPGLCFSALRLPDGLRHELRPRFDGALLVRVCQFFCSTAQPHEDVCRPLPFGSQAVQPPNMALVRCMCVFKQRVYDTFDETLRTYGRR